MAASRKSSSQTYVSRHVSMRGTVVGWQGVGMLCKEGRSGFEDPSSY